ELQGATHVRYPRWSDLLVRKVGRKGAPSMPVDDLASEVEFARMRGTVWVGDTDDRRGGIDRSDPSFALPLGPAVPRKFRGERHRSGILRVRSVHPVEDKICREGDEELTGLPCRSCHGFGGRSVDQKRGSLSSFR